MAEPLDVNEIPNLHDLIKIKFDQKKIDEFFNEFLGMFQNLITTKMALIEKKANTEIQKLKDAQQKQNKSQTEPYIVY